MAKQNTSVIHRFFDSLSPLADADTNNYGIINDWQYIWAAVIMQAFSDIKSVYRDPVNIKRRQEAIAWLGTPDFVTVCDFANINPCAVKEYALSLARCSDDGHRLPNLGRKARGKAQSGVRLRIHTS